MLMLLRAPAGPTARHHSSAHYLLHVLLRVFAANFNLRPTLRRYLRSDQGWITFTVAVATVDGAVEAGVRFANGKVRVLRHAPAGADARLTFASDGALRRLLKAGPAEQVQMVMRSDLRMDGNASYANLFLFFVSLLLHRPPAPVPRAATPEPATARALADRRACRLAAPSIDPGVKWLPEPYLSAYSLDDFPRLRTFLDGHFTIKPAVCPELPKLLTDWHKANGFETDAGGRPWVPVLRKAHAYKHVLAHRRPIIHRDDLIAGTTTSKEIGVVVYPDGGGTMIWSELLSVATRELNPYDVEPDTRAILHHEVFPYWVDRNFKEWVRTHYDNPLCQRIDERYALYFDWKQVTISHTIPDFPKLLRLGARGLIDEIAAERDRDGIDPEKRDTLTAMILCLEGLIAYSHNLARQAAADAAAETHPRRRAELERLAAVCARVVEHPARTLDEAVNAMWIAWVGLHMESTNAGLSLGRLDQWLQPYFDADMAALATETDRTAYLRHAIELVGCFFMRCTDHLPLTPDFANYYFGGSSSDQAITLGGVTPDGDDAVNDMTYIFLKVTEMLGLRDPNVNARFCPGTNTDTYLKRLCEVNLITAATPSLHNDAAITAALAQFGYAAADVRNWSATGCVEPTLSGKHIGHTNFQMMNMVAALEMALHNGYHPLTDWHLGPETGAIEDGTFATFDQFFDAFTTQFAFLIDQSVAYNTMLGEAHQHLRPTPLLSALIDGCIAKGRDVTRGGATYNSSGAALIGLADVTDSLMVIKKLVYDERRVPLTALKRAVDTNFAHDPALHATVMNQVPFFGSGSDEAVAMADRVARFAHDYYASRPHYRGGHYTVGFWSMSNHVVFGTLTGALPSGRLRGKPFTPGLTPEPNASPSLLDNIRDVARLDPTNITNNIAFNVKVVPGARESRAQTVDHMFAYVKTYFALGGMQMQLNVVNSGTLRDAMAHPEHYRNLLVRISGYNAYFVTLNRDMQLELIERAEYGL